MGNKPPELYYDILHVARDASPQRVRAAYRSLVRQWHPDKHPPESRPAAEARFKAITEAYEALLGQQGNMSAAPAVAARDGERSSPADKDRADSAAVSARPRAARSGKAGGAPCTPEREEPAFKTVVYSASSSVGGGRGRRALAEFSSYVVRKAPPLERRVECTLEELCSGCHKEVRYTRDVVTKNGWCVMLAASACM